MSKSDNPVKYFGGRVGKTMHTSLILPSLFLVLSLPVHAQTVASVNPADDYFPLREKHYQHPLSNSTWRKAVNSFVQPGLSLSEIEKLKSSPEKKKETAKTPVTKDVPKVQKKFDGFVIQINRPLDGLSAESRKVVPETIKSSKDLPKKDSLKKTFELVSLPQNMNDIQQKPVKEVVSVNTRAKVHQSRIENQLNNAPHDYARIPVPEIAPLPPERKAAPLVLSPQLPITEVRKPQSKPDNTVVSCEGFSLTKEEVRELVSRIAKEEGIDPKLAEAIAMVESDLGSNQVSGAGAVGIMQLMPDAAAEMGVKDRCHPEQNIRGGIKYFRKMLDEFDDPLLALGAYNAGARRVYERRGIPTNNETVAYIVKVLNHWLDYDAHLSGRRKSTTGRSLAGIEDTIPEAVNTVEAVNSNNWVEGHLITD